MQEYVTVCCFFVDYTLQDYARCTQAGLKVGANIFGVYVTAGVQGGSCDSLLNEMGGEVPHVIRQTCFLNPHELRLKSVHLSPDNTVHGSMVEDFVAVVKGGTSDAITALLAKKLPSPEVMRLWGEGVRFNPEFLRSTVSFSVLPCLFRIHIFPFLFNLVVLSENLQ